MKPKEKAEYLINKFTSFESFFYHEAVECAIIACDEIIDVLIKIEDEQIYGFGSEYWKEVKKEIKDL